MLEICTFQNSGNIMSCKYDNVSNVDTFWLIQIIPKIGPVLYCCRLCRCDASFSAMGAVGCEGHPN